MNTGFYIGGRPKKRKQPTNPSDPTSDPPSASPSVSSGIRTAPSISVGLRAPVIYMIGHPFNKHSRRINKSLEEILKEFITEDQFNKLDSVSRLFANNYDNCIEFIINIIKLNESSGALSEFTKPKLTRLLLLIAPDKISDKRFLAISTLIQSKIQNLKDRTDDILTGYLDETSNVIDYYKANVCRFNRNDVVIFKKDNILRLGIIVDPLPSSCSDLKKTNLTNIEYTIIYIDIGNLNAKSLKTTVTEDQIFEIRFLTDRELDNLNIPNRDPIEFFNLPKEYKIVLKSDEPIEYRGKSFIEKRIGCMTQCFRSGMDNLELWVQLGCVFCVEFKEIIGSTTKTLFHDWKWKSSRGRDIGLDLFMRKRQEELIFFDEHLIPFCLEILPDDDLGSIPTIEEYYERYINDFFIATYDLKEIEKATSLEEILELYLTTSEDYINRMKIIISEYYQKKKEIVIDLMDQLKEKYKEMRDSVDKNIVVMDYLLMIIKNLESQNKWKNRDGRVEYKLSTEPCKIKLVVDAKVFVRGSEWFSKKLEEKYFLRWEKHNYKTIDELIEGIQEKIEKILK